MYIPGAENTYDIEEVPRLEEVVHYAWKRSRDQIGTVTGDTYRILTEFSGHFYSVVLF